MYCAGKSHIALTSLFVVVLAATLNDAAPLYSSAAVAIIDLQTKLDAMAAGKQLGSGITFEQLKEAYELVEKSSPTIREKMMSFHGFRIVIDFAVNPMRFQAEHLANDPVLFALHMDRVESAYKRFKPAYAGEQIGDRAFRIKTNNSGKLYSLLKNPESKITMRDWERGKMEANNWRARLEELTTTEDIFSCLEELESILNYFNFRTFKPLYEHIYPNLGTNLKDAEQARKAYYEALWRDYSIRFENGVPTRIINGMQAEQRAGFTKVINL